MMESLHISSLAHFSYKRGVWCCFIEAGFTIEAQNKPCFTTVWVNVTEEAARRASLQPLRLQESQGEYTTFTKSAYLRKLVGKQERLVHKTWTWFFFFFRFLMDNIFAINAELSSQLCMLLWNILMSPCKGSLAFKKIFSGLSVLMVKCYQFTTPLTGTLRRGWWQGWYQQNGRVSGGHPREMQMAHQDFPTACTLKACGYQWAYRSGGPVGAGPTRLMEQVMSIYLRGNIIP